MVGFGGSLAECKSWQERGLLEAAIGIEPMNKGFAVSEGLFSRDHRRAELCLFVGLFMYSS